MHLERHQIYNIPRYWYDSKSGRIVGFNSNLWARMSALVPQDPSNQMITIIRGSPLLDRINKEIKSFPLTDRGIKPMF